MLKPEIVKIVNIFFVMFGFFIIWANLKILRRHKKSTNWEKTKGVIRKSKFDDSKLHFHRTIYPSDEAYIEYEYSVENKKYSSQNIYNLQKDERSAKDAHKVLQKYYPNKIVTVYYNSTNPNESFLEIDSTLELYIYLTVGISFVFFSILKLLTYSY